MSEVDGAQAEKHQHEDGKEEEGNDDTQNDQDAHPDTTDQDSTKEDAKDSSLPQQEDEDDNTENGNEDNEDKKKEEGKDDSAAGPPTSKLREKTYMPTKDDTQRECACSDQDFVRLIASDSSVLCKTINRWQQSYQLDVTDLKEKALRLIKGDFRDLYGDLDPEEQEKIEREIARLQRERTELLMGAIGRLAKENTLT